jgi:hypothetical protein
MRSDSKRRFVLAAVVLGMMVAAVPQAEAAPIIYTETAVGSGTLGTTSFTNAAITLTSTADTTNVTNPLASFFGVTNTSAQVTVDSLGTATFTISTDTFDNQTFSPPAAGVGATSGGSILDTLNTAFATYNLKSSIGPVSGAAFIVPGQAFGTNLGNFVLNSISGNVTFQATIGTAVPEPTSLVMGATALAAGAIYSLRRRRAA